MLRLEELHKRLALDSPRPSAQRSVFQRGRHVKRGKIWKAVWNLDGGLESISVASFLYDFPLPYFFLNAALLALWIPSRHRTDVLVKFTASDQDSVSKIGISG